jgi:hypothetical protein
MKRIFILSLFMVALFPSCYANGGKDPKTTGNASSGETTISGQGTITCVIDGKPVSIIVQNRFFPITLNPDSKGPTDGLELMDGSAKKEGFQFEIKDHGTTNIRGGADNILCIFTYFGTDGAAYVGKDVVVTVTSSSGNHLTGTFSGKFKKVIGREIISITNGKFDLLR